MRGSGGSPALRPSGVRSAPPLLSPRECAVYRKVKRDSFTISKAGHYVDKPRWALPTAPADANASVDKTRRPDRRGQRADEILPVEDILHTEESLEVAADRSLGRDIDYLVPRKPGIGGRRVLCVAQRRGRYHSRVQIVVELPAHELQTDGEVDVLRVRIRHVRRTAVGWHLRQELADERRVRDAAIGHLGLVVEISA